MTYAHITDGIAACPRSAFGRFLPVVTTACAGQVECKRLASLNASDWSVVVQIGGQITAISHQLRLQE